MRKDLILALSILITIIIFISGCTNGQIDLSQFDTSKLTKEDIDKLITCNKPYIRHEAGCCLDQNNNRICDDDELSTTVSTTVMIRPTILPTTTHIPTTTQKIYEEESLKFFSIDDTYISQSEPDTIFGITNPKELKVSSNIKGVHNELSSIKFDIVGVKKNVKEATLHVYATEGCSSKDQSEACVNVHAMYNSDWSESTMTANNFPAGNQLLDKKFNMQPGWNEFDVTSMISPIPNYAPGITKFSFILITGQNDNSIFSSKETENIPWLEVKLTDERTTVTTILYHEKALLGLRTGDSDYKEITMKIGDTTSCGDKTLLLENVGDFAVLVDINGVKATVDENETETVNGCAIKVLELLY